MCLKIRESVLVYNIPQPEHSSPLAKPPRLEIVSSTASRTWKTTPSFPKCRTWGKRQQGCFDAQVELRIYSSRLFHVVRFLVFLNNWRISPSWGVFWVCWDLIFKWQPCCHTKVFPDYFINLIRTFTKSVMYRIYYCKSVMGSNLWESPFPSDSKGNMIDPDTVMCSRGETICHVQSFLDQIQNGKLIV